VPGTQTKPRPRLADVARQAGVSPATASRVLTGSARVRPETRQEVEDAIAQLGYVRNRAARSSGSRRVGSIAFVVCEDNARVFSEPFFPLMLRSVSRELASCDIQLVLLTVHSPRDYQTASRYLRSGHVDGAVLASMHGGRPFDPAQPGHPRGAGRPPVRRRRWRRVLLRGRGQRRRGQDGRSVPPEERPHDGGHRRRAARPWRRAWTGSAATARPWPTPGVTYLTPAPDRLRRLRPRLSRAWAVPPARPASQDRRRVRRVRPDGRGGTTGIAPDRAPGARGRGRHRLRRLAAGTAHRPEADHRPASPSRRWAPGWPANCWP